MVTSTRTATNLAAETSVELLLGAQAGREGALEELLSRYIPRLRQWASGRLPRGLRSMRDTGDLVQDAVAAVLPHLATLEIRSDQVLWFYLKQAVRNRIIDLYRRSGRRPARTEMPADLVATGLSAQELLIQAEEQELYEAALDALSEEERRTLSLRNELGLDFKQVADELGKTSADAARMAYGRARRQLVEEIKRLRRAKRIGS